MTWFYEVSPFFQYAGIPHPARIGGSRGDT